MTASRPTREALDLIDSGHGWEVAVNVAQNRKSSQHAVAMALIGAGETEAVADCISDFTGLWSPKASLRIQLGEPG